VIETGWFPGIGVVTTRAWAKKVVGRRIVVMASYTGPGGACIATIAMAGFTLEIRVLTGEREEVMLRSRATRWEADSAGVDHPQTG